MSKSEATLQAMLEPTQRNHEKVNAVTGGEMRHLHHVPKVKCADGFEMSVQASEFHYCTPRDSRGPWFEVEVGFPTQRVEAFMPYIDGETAEPTGTVYGYVPISIVADVIDGHGGFAEPEPPQ